MKINFIVIFFILIAYPLHGQFLGGNNDGNDLSSLTGTKLNGEIASFTVLYQGSSGDGFDSHRNELLLSTSNFNIYQGSSGDGFSQNNATVTINGNDINSLYFGNSGDGHSQDKFQSVLTGADLSILFKGNIGDGFDKDILSSVFLKGIILTMFNGGNGDGFDSSLKPNNYLSGLMLMLYNGGNGDGFASNILTSALTLDVVDHLVKLNVLLYPNPANHIVTIKPNDGVTITSIEMFDISGKKINIRLSDSNTLNVSNLSNGVYLLNIISKTGSVTKKLIVKK